MSRLRKVAVATAAALSLITTLTPAHADQAAWRSLDVTSARTDNPLKGFLPFTEADHDRAKANFPYTMEWLYLPLKAVVKGEKSYDWSEFNSKLDAIAGRGNQVALRFYLDYPTKETGVPDYLLGEGGIDQSRRYEEYENARKSFSPNYEDPRVQSLIKDFVAEFGKKYDGDPRIGYITTGLIGFWGEQHTYPMNGENGKEQWMPSPATELSYYKAWDEAFDTTKLLNRNPQAGLDTYALGFHDDSFAHSTLPPTDWHFLSKMKQAGLDKRWATEAIGGEVRPEVQKCAFAGGPCRGGLALENFGEAVKETHATWLVNNFAYAGYNGEDPNGYQGEAKQKALAAHASLGYDFAVTQYRIQPTASGTEVSVKITNRGVAPFYYDWPVQFALLDGGKVEAVEQLLDAKLSSIQPGQSVELKATLPSGPGTVALHIPNTLEGGAPVKFSNKTQDADLDGYLTLGTVNGGSPSSSASASSSSSKAGSGQPGLPRTEG